MSRLTIQKILDELLPECYSEELYNQKCEAIYQHIYECYYGDDSSVYTIARGESRLI